MEIVGFEVSDFFGVDVVDVGVVRTGRPAREAWIVDVGALRWVPGPGI